MQEPWWILWPGRLDAELAELEKHSIRYEFDSDAFEKGRVVLQLQRTLNGEDLELTADILHLIRTYFKAKVGIRFRKSCSQLEVFTI